MWDFQLGTALPAGTESGEISKSVKHVGHAPHKIPVSFPFTPVLGSQGPSLSIATFIQPFELIITFINYKTGPLKHFLLK